ncbi:MULTISPECIES: glycosyltransferase family 9 protein [unclassified Cyanobium]|uniref:glycosyltransferase family 9 protein n=1 Tax=unclassified Cyanobium TaxID=2627006 RepID=UPI0020CEC90A|nr:MULTISPECIES: glycosyltransferase family 9 protein [unclassified Cyanobium]MCP9834880.1 glycosyltransferase family 9 protein [Cyanobium sp. La Preciosa 7G6]MCP9937643.1 glycosyltransferase family 9 protein [Cyanobium sp. Aljojuca 7A6]
MTTLPGLMRRFQNQDLGPRPQIVVLGAAKLGNYVVLQPLLRGLRHKYPSAQLTYVGSQRTRELERLNPWIDASLPLAEQGPAALAALAQWRRSVPDRANGDGVALVINADGHAPHTAAWTRALAPRFVVGAAPIPPGDHPLQALALDPHWASPTLMERYGGWIGSNSIRELHCRVAWVDTDFERVELPAETPPPGLPPVLIAVNGERAAKLWPLENWLALLEKLQLELGLAARGIGLIGGPPPAEPRQPGDRLERALLARAAGLRDLRGRLSLPALVGALAHSRLCIAVDSGPLHLAAAAGCPTVALFGTDAGGLGSSPRDLWAPRADHVWISRSQHRCNGCQQLRFENPACPLEQHACMEGLPPEAVWPLVQRAWQQNGPA